MTLTLSDNFNDNSFDTAKWAKDGDAAQSIEQNQRLEITHGVNIEYNATLAFTTYDLTGNDFFVKIVDAGNQALTSHSAIFGFSKDATNKVWFNISTDTITAYKQIGGVNTQIGSGISYSSTTHVFFRFREASGTIYWDTSSDRVTWTNRWSLANPFVITAITPYMQTGCWQNEASGSYTYFDDFDISGFNSYPMMHHIQLTGGII